MRTDMADGMGVNGGGRSHVDHVLAVAADRSASARSALAASWTRSVQRYGLDPSEAAPPARLCAAELREARARMEPMLAVAQASLDQLFQAVGGSGCCVLFTDRDGVPVDRRGAAGDDALFERWGLWTGVLWSEQSEGTNGIGTCIAEERAMTIHREQHFHARNTRLSCTVSPVHDHEGRLAAALDVSSCRGDLIEGMLSLIAHAVAEAARRIEMQNFRQAFAGARIMLAPDASRSAAALIAVDADDLVVGATRAARLAYGITSAQLARSLPAATILGGMAAGADANHADDLERAERGALQRALASTGGNVSATAKSLGISRATLHRKINRLGIYTTH